MSNVQLISVHIPKTAGTTFRNLLMQAYGNDRVCCDYPGEYKGSGTTSVTSQTVAIHGHFPISKYASVNKSANWIVWLRHPISRLISYYFYGKNNPETTSLDVQNMSLLEFAKLSVTQNEIARYLEGVSLHDFHFIGLQEFFLEDLTDLKTLMDWSSLQLSRHDNQNKNDNYNTFFQEILKDSKLLSKLITLNSVDMSLYAEALELRAQRRNELSHVYQLQMSWQWVQPELDRLAAEVTRFKEMLVLAQPYQSRSLNQDTEPQDSENLLESFNHENFLKETQQLSHEDFVVATYRRYLKREPDKSGYSNYLHKLNNGMQRQQILQSFYNSKEFKKLVSKSKNE